MQQASNELTALAAMVLDRCGFVENAGRVCDALKDELEGVYGDVSEDEFAPVDFHGTVIECYGLFENSDFSTCVQRFKSSARAFLQSVSSDDCLHVEASTSHHQRCTLNVALPASPAASSSTLIDMQIVFTLNYGYSTKVEVQPETSTNADESTVAMARLAYLMAGAG